MYDGCPFENCGTLYELLETRVMESSDDIGYCWVNEYQCVAGHVWHRVIEKSPEAK